MNIANFPPIDTPAWKRMVEQRIVELESKIFRLEAEVSYLRNQVGNLPVNPNVTVP